MNDQIEKNRKAYDIKKDRLEAENLGCVALLHDGEIIEIYNDMQDAYKIGKSAYGLGYFSLERIGERPVSLGIYTMCLPH